MRSNAPENDALIAVAQFYKVFLHCSLLLYIPDYCEVLKCETNNS